MDLEKGKKIFFKYNGNSFSIDRECGKEYRKCKVPVELEKQWLEEIKMNLLDGIQNEIGDARMCLIIAYVRVIDMVTAIEFLISALNQKDMDTFSAILLAENLKRRLREPIDDQLKNRIEVEIENFKNRALQSKIEIEDSYKRSRFMKYYDFSDENIIRRINAI